jgi:hypothetical protein
MLTCRAIKTGFRCALTATLIVGAAHGGDSSDLGADYALLSLMTVSPDFAAAHYTIENDGPDVGIYISRLPYHIDLAASGDSSVQLELMLAYQRAKQVIDTFSSEGESIDSTWETYGASIGLLYEKGLPHGFYISPSLRFGITETRNHTVYEGFESDEISNLLDGTLLNWHLRTRTVELGLGVGYRLKLGDRTGRIESTLSHALAESFDESDAAALGFSEGINVLSTLIDVIYPTDLSFLDDRLDLVLLGGHHHSFGENRRTLGYTDSYQLGIGLERPLNVGTRIRRYLRVSGQVLWAEKMNGWLLSISLDYD